MKLLTNFCCGAALAGVLLTGSAGAEAYAPGTFSFKPLNVNIASFTLRKNLKDMRFATIGTQANGNNVQVNHDGAAFHAPLSFGFAECDRGGYGYGAEAGYVVGADTEIFARGGFNRETPSGQFVVGDMSLRFKARTNYGFALGLRKYVDMKSVWKPFFGFAGGFVRQGDANATVFAHGRRSGAGVEFDNVSHGNYRIQRSITNYNLELAAGTDYEFTKNISMTFSVGMRYHTRSNRINSITTPQVVVQIPVANITVPSRTLTIKDNKQRWHFPVTVSLKIKL